MKAMKYSIIILEATIITELSTDAETMGTSKSTSLLFSFIIEVKNMSESPKYIHLCYYY